MPARRPVSQIASLFAKTSRFAVSGAFLHRALAPRRQSSGTSREAARTSRILHQMARSAMQSARLAELAASPPLGSSLEIRWHAGCAQASHVEALMQWSVDITSLKPIFLGSLRLRRRLRAQGITSVEIDCSGLRRPSVKMLRGLRVIAIASEQQHCSTSLVGVEPELLVLLDMCRLSASFQIHSRLAPNLPGALEVEPLPGCDSISAEAQWAA